MITFSLSSFLKICQLDTPDQISNIDRKMSGGGGYDFYKTLVIAIRGRLNGKGPDYVRDILESPSNAVEREYNKTAYRNFMGKYGKKRNVEVLRSARKYSIREYGISIQCDPVFATQEGGVQHVHAIWATNKPELLNRYAAVGCFILKENYKNTSLGNSRFCIANLVDGSRITDRQITNMTPKILKRDAKTISEMASEA